MAEEPSGGPERSDEPGPAASSRGRRATKARSAWPKADEPQETGPVEHDEPAKAASTQGPRATKARSKRRKAEEPTQAGPVERDESGEPSRGATAGARVEPPADAQSSTQGDPPSESEEEARRSIARRRQGIVASTVDSMSEEDAEALVRLDVAALESIRHSATRREAAAEVAATAAEHPAYDAMLRRDFPRIAEEAGRAEPSGAAERATSDTPQAGAPPEAEATREAPEATNEISEARTRVHTPTAEESERDRLLKSLQVRFLKEAGREVYYDRTTGEVAFALRDGHIVSSNNDPAVVRGMTDLARAQGWGSIEVRGAQAFRRAAWLAASAAGLEVQGYRPDRADATRLEELQSPPRPVRPERAPAASPTAAARDDAAPATTGRVVDERRLSPMQETALTALEQTLRERGDSEPQIAMALAVARERLDQHRVYAGQVVAYGAAPYEFDPANDKSFYIKLRGPDGAEQTVWGVHIADAIEKGDVAVGENVFLAYQGRQQVVVRAKERDDAGKVIGMKDVATHRNAWLIEKFDQIDAWARANGTARENGPAAPNMERRNTHLAHSSGTGIGLARYAPTGRIADRGR